MGELVFVLELLKNSLEVLLPGFQALPGRVLLADPLNCLFQFLLDRTNSLFVLFKLPAAPHKVDEEQDHSVVVMVAGIPGYLCRFLIFLRTEVVFEP